MAANAWLDCAPHGPPDTAAPQPTALVVHNRSRVLEIGFADGCTFKIPFELMRIYSPSAEVQGHGPGQETLQTGKREVDVAALEPVGRYAVQPRFSDGHDTGIYSWEYLRRIDPAAAVPGDDHPPGASRG